MDTRENAIVDDLDYKILVTQLKGMREECVWLVKEWPIYTS